MKNLRATKTDAQFRVRKFVLTRALRGIAEYLR